MFNVELPEPSARAHELQPAMHVFMRDRVLPAETEYAAQRRAAGADNHSVPEAVGELKREACKLGFWNLLPEPTSPRSARRYAS